MLKLRTAVVWIQCLLVMTGCTEKVLQEKLDKCQTLTNDTLRDWNDTIWSSQGKTEQLFQETMDKCQNSTSKMLKNWNKQSCWAWQEVKIGGKLINTIVEKGAAELLGVLLDDGMDVNTITEVVDRENRNMTIISQAAYRNASNIVELLINRKASLELSSYHNWTPLMYAAQQGNPSTVELLLKYGANINATTAEGANALFPVALREYLKVMYILIINGINIDAKENSYRRTALLWAAKTGKQCSVKCLLEFGADKLATDKNNKTAAELAKDYKHSEIFECLSNRCDNLSNCKCF